jgi:membrane-bound lytic murein transglycosylase D
VGSVAEQEAASEIEQADVDPWADAFADSSRAAIVTAIAARPAYPVSINPQVQYFLDRFTGARRDVVNLWVGRSGRYLGMIREVLRSRGLPEELAYTAMIESGFNPLAVSRVGAKGMWQFMAATARRYGLRVDRWIDERLDPEKSTVAAAAYLKDLYNIFGSWPLAQAAYNAGEMRVIRAIRATGSSDFWALAETKHLHPETKNFVPAIHAATLIGENAAQYGFEFAEADTPQVEAVAVPPSTDLRRLASKAGIAPGELKVLNPVLVRAMTPPGGAWSLRVPAGTRSNVLTALAPPAPRRPHATAKRAATTRPVGAREDVHVVRPRETVSSIAKQYGVAVADVLRWNRLEQRAHIRPGDRLRIADLHRSASEGQGGFR